MTFLYPLFLIGTLAIAIPLVLHLMQRRTDVVVDFPAVRLLDKVPVQQQRRRRLRELVLLALRMMALALLALAFARPYFQNTTAAMPSPVSVIAVDVSLSLSAPGQVERLRQSARRAVDEVPATNTVALVTFADTATLVVPPTTDRGGVLTAIDQIKITAGGTRFRTALARAAETITSEQGSIVVVTDLQQAGWDANDEGAVADGVTVSVVEIPSPAGNVAVTAARRDDNGIVAAIHNFGASSVRVPVQLRLGDRELARQAVDVGPQAAADVRFAVALPARGGAEIRVEDREGYQADNSRFLVLDPPPVVPIVIVTAEPPASSNAGLYVERALAAADEGRSFGVRVIDRRTFSALPATEAEHIGAIILLGTTTLDRAGRDRVAAFLRGGGRVLLTLGPDIDVATLAETVATPVGIDDPVAQPSDRTVALIAVDTRHPIFRPFSSPTGALGDVYVETFRRLKIESGRTVLARFSGAGDALVEQTVERGRLLVFASDLDNRWNRFPLNPAFVPWMAETARYLVQGREVQQSYTLPIVPAGVALEPGIHRVADRPITVNTDTRESNPLRMSPESFAAGITRAASTAGARAVAAAKEQEDRQRLWQIGLLVMFLALAGEGFVGRKAV